jgi:nucleoside-diphosphate-sugar epimerase
MDSHSPILVTGANGYLASWVVKGLLDAGHAVHATVRSTRDRTKTQHLEQLARSPQLSLFEADLLTRGSFDAAMSGCETVIHTASPFKIERIQDPEAELVRPAVDGVSNVLESASRTPSVRRVVLTSSMVALYGDASEIRGSARGVFTEDDWNRTSSLQHQPYPYSKTLAERRAWDLARLQDRWTLVTLCPGFMLGPALDPSNAGTSNTLMTRMANGGYRSGVPDMWFGIVDVRDAARAHVIAAERDVSGRFIISGRDASLVEVAAILRRKFGEGYPLPRGAAPKPILWLIAPRLGFTRRYIARNVGFPVRLDNSRSMRELGMTYTPLEQTVADHFQQMISTGKAAQSRGAQVAGPTGARRPSPSH